MKKVLCLIIAIFMMLPVNAYAMENDVVLNDEPVAVSDDNVARISGLITSYSIKLSKSGSTLKLVANTTCVTDVTKCGLKELIIQKRSSTSNWENYIVFNDLYANSSSHSYSKSYTVPSNYQYRATCKHYAKKSIFNTQTIDNTSNTV